jgi:phosphoglycolate phosphatase
MLRLALFDCDGTLVDSQGAIVAAMQAPPAARIRRVVGLSLVEAVAHLIPEEAPALHVEIAEAYKAAFQANRQSGLYWEPLYPGTVAALDRLRDAGFLLGIATGKSLRGLLAVLEHHGLRDRFVTLQTADFGPGKPHPDMVERALAESGADRAGTVMIGDTSYDMAMARNARVRALGVTWGYHPADELRGSGADRIVDDYADVPGAVADLVP